MGHYSLLPQEGCSCFHQRTVVPFTALASLQDWVGMMLSDLTSPSVLAPLLVGGIDLSLAVL